MHNGECRSCRDLDLLRCQFETSAHHNARIDQQYLQSFLSNPKYAEICPHFTAVKNAFTGAPEDVISDDDPSTLEAAIVMALGSESADEAGTPETEVLAEAASAEPEIEPSPSASPPLPIEALAQIIFDSGDLRPPAPRKKSKKTKTARPNGHQGKSASLLAAKNTGSRDDYLKARKIRPDLIPAFQQMTSQIRRATYLPDLLDLRDELLDTSHQHYGSIPSNEKAALLVMVVQQVAETTDKNWLQLLYHLRLET